MRDVVRYSEAFKLRLVEDMASGKYKSLDEAKRRNGIRRGATLNKWIKQYGREDILPKRMKVETMNEIDELQAARSRIRELEAAKQERYNIRTTVERGNSHLKDSLIRRSLYVKGYKKYRLY
ncbi:MAG: transposase [Treponema sp.]|jgi:transposase-like protein|nr:transposase [Treponema sp.]